MTDPSMIGDIVIWGVAIVLIAAFAGLALKAFGNK
ncbi:hypothetical protein BAC3_00698 [uncultured bacterium]|nr:hypothetical protein BAC3_00698 [uncultured bacterium]